MSSLLAPLRNTVRETGAFAYFLLDVVRATARYGVKFAPTLAESYKIGVQSLPILLTISLFIGTNLALQGHNAFAPLGGQRLVGMFVALAGVRELAPIIAAAMIAAKAGTEMASQIGVMRIREQIDALEVMAVNPYAELVTPRLFGILGVLPALTIVAIFTMIGASFAMSVWQLGINASVFMEFATQAVRPIDFIYGMIKAFFFGVIICTVSCYFGFTAGRGPEGVGEATNKAVVVSSVACVALNYLLSEILYGGAL